MMSDVIEMATRAEREAGAHLTVGRHLALRAGTVAALGCRQWVEDC